MKSRILAISVGVASLHLLVIGTFCTTAGCKSPEVLKDRPYIPSPVETPAQNLSALPSADAPALPALPEIKTEPVKYTVEKNDSFWKIARKYGVSKEELAEYNKMSLTKPLKVGAVIMIPPGGALIPADKLPPIKKSVTEKGATASKGAPVPADGAYTVANGDSLWKIAAKYNIKTDALVAANNLDPKKALQVGQKIQIPVAGATGKAASAAASAAAPSDMDVTPAPTAPSENKAATPSEEEKLLNELDGGSASSSPSAAVGGGTFADHEVTDGESIEEIASMYGIKPDDIRKANPGLPADGKLKAPLTLKVPENR